MDEPKNQTYTINISEYYFRLITESIRLYSNSMLKICSASDVVNNRANCASSIASSYRAESLKKHLRIIPTFGDVVFDIEVLETNAEKICDIIPDIESLINTDLSFASALSIVLFDYIVEENRTELFTKLKLNVEDAKSYREAAVRNPSNVLPFR